VIRAERIGLAFGGVFCALSLLLAVLDPKAALTGWLAAFVFWSSLPIGAVGLVMMIRLIPGEWSREVAPAAETALLLLPLAAIAAFPILIGVHVVYDWSVAPPEEGFRGTYLTAWFFVLRTLIAFAAMIALAALLLVRRSLSAPVACIGLIVLVLLDTLLATDWIMSLDSEFHSSGFGLYVLCMQMTAALALSTGARLLSADRNAEPKLLGALMLTGLLFWTYFTFMQFFIIWSGNFPHEVTWYRHHGEGVWGAAEYLIAALNLAPLLLLMLLSPLRRSRAALLAIAAAVLVGRAVESTWLVIASVKVDLLTALGAAGLGFVGLGCLSAVVFLWSTRNFHGTATLHAEGRP
jgi:hypothetical protein